MSTRRGFLKTFGLGVAGALVAANTLLTRAEPEVLPAPPPEVEADDFIDLRGKPFSPDDMQAAADIVRAQPTYGRPTHIWMPKDVARELGYDVDNLVRES